MSSPKSNIKMSSPKSNIKIISDSNLKLNTLDNNDNNNNDSKIEPKPKQILTAAARRDLDRIFGI